MSLHPSGKFGQSSTDVMNMESEVVVNYSACKCNLSIILILGCTNELHCLLLQLKSGSISQSLFQKPQEEYGFVDKWLPLIDYLCTFGLKESHFTYIYDRYMASAFKSVRLQQKKGWIFYVLGLKARI
jgi:mTERF domain-containing protein